MLGRFLELSVQTRDIRESVAFYERLGFTQCAAGDVWSHPYGVLTDGRLVIGLHQYRFPSPSLTFVHADIAKHAAQFTRDGFELAFQRLEPEVFNEIGLRDPSAQMIAVLEARTYSPCARGRDEPSLCGDFVGYSIPTRDFAKSRSFWDRLGFVVGDEEIEDPYVHVEATSDALDLAFHRPRFSDRPLCVFRAEDMARRLDVLEAAGYTRSPELPALLDPAKHALIETPEGLGLLLTAAS